MNTKSSTVYANYPERYFHSQSRQMVLLPDNYIIILGHLFHKFVMINFENDKYEISFCKEFIKNSQLNELKLKEMPIEISPCAMCLHEIKEKIFVDDYFKGFIYIFEYKLKDKRGNKDNLTFTYINHINKLKNRIKVDCIFDLVHDNKNKYLYASDTNNNVVSVINTGNGKEITYIRIDRPKNTKLYNGALYVLSETDSEARILCFDTKHNELKKIIKLDKFCCARCLYIDNSLIFTTGYQINNEEIVDWSNIFLLCYSDENNTLRYKLKLNFQGLYNMCVLKRRDNVLIFHFLIEYMTKDKERTFDFIKIPLNTNNMK